MEPDVTYKNVKRNQVSPGTSGTWMKLLRMANRNLVDRLGFELVINVSHCLMLRHWVKHRQEVTDRKYMLIPPPPQVCGHLNLPSWVRVHIPNHVPLVLCAKNIRVYFRT